MAKENLPAIHLYPGDWVTDSIAGCSLAAQGLWLRMMFLAHKAERYGYLEVNGSPIPPTCIAQRCGATAEQYESLLSELVAAGVPSKSDDGILYSRRMVKDASLRAVRAKSGKKGGKQKASNIRSKTLANTEDENESDTDPGFNSFWKMFPSFRKHAKGKARVAWKRARDKAAEEVILAAVEEYAASEVAQTQFVKGPEPWLNGECWDDDRNAWKQRDGKAGTTRDGSRHRYKGD